jgi:hypothetical protein
MGIPYSAYTFSLTAKTESDGSNAQMLVFPVKTLTKICINDCVVVQIL